MIRKVITVMLAYAAVGMVAIWFWTRSPQCFRERGEHTHRSGRCVWISAHDRYLVDFRITGHTLLCLGVERGAVFTALSVPVDPKPGVSPWGLRRRRFRIWRDRFEGPIICGEPDIWPMSSVAGGPGGVSRPPIVRLVLGLRAPCWAAFIFFSAYPTLVFIRGPLRRWRRRRKGLCVKCGYNLTGLPEPRCPECGAKA